MDIIKGDNVKPGSNDMNFIEEEALINFRHLESLEFRFRGHTGEEYTSWAVYSEPVDRNVPTTRYRIVEAHGEGCGCVDDVSRVAYAYLVEYEKRGETGCLDKAKKALQFIMYMSDGNGLFYNFVDGHGNINKTGETSAAKMDWWTARAFHALGKGMQIFMKTDPEFAEQLKNLQDKTLKRLVEFRKDPDIDPECRKLHEKYGIKPGKVVYGSGTITAIFLLGLLDRYKADRNPDAADLIKDYCDSIVKMRETSQERYPFRGFHANSLWQTDTVHLYGNLQVKALAEAYEVFHKNEWLESAEIEANTIYPFILSSGHMPYALSPEPELYPQIAYSVGSVMANLTSLYKTTGKAQYAVMSGLFGAWFFGDNRCNREVYITATGRGFDGIDENCLSVNCGAESTIESIRAMQDIELTPGARFMRFKDSGDKSREMLIVPAGNCMYKSGLVKKLKRHYSGGMPRHVLSLDTSGSIRGKTHVKHDGNFRIYLSCRTEGFGEEACVQAVIDDLNFVVSFPGFSGYRFFKAIPAGKFYRDKSGMLEFTLENNRPEGPEVQISSVIFQPDLQMKTWSDGNESISLMMNTSSEDLSACPEFGEISGLIREVLFTGNGSGTSAMPPDGWILFRTHQSAVKNGDMFSARTT